MHFFSTPRQSTVPVSGGVLHSLFIKKKKINHNSKHYVETLPYRGHFIPHKEGKCATLSGMLFKNRKVKAPFATVPDLPGVYFIFDETLQPCYVGRSRNLFERLKGHTRSDGKFHKHVRAGRFSYIVTKYLEQARTLEKKCLLAVGHKTANRFIPPKVSKYAKKIGRY